MNRVVLFTGILGLSAGIAFLSAAVIERGHWLNLIPPAMMIVNSSLILSMVIPVNEESNNRETVVG